jgi:thymidylate kinase
MNSPASKPVFSTSAAVPGSVAVEIGSLVRRCFAGLDARKIVWAVLRGSDGLPDHTRYDIDLLIRPEDTEVAETALREAATAEGWSLVRIVDKFGYRCCLMISPGPVRRYLPIDLFGGCHHRFYEIADGEYALGARLYLKDGVAVVPPGFGAAVAVIKELMRHSHFKEDSREEVRAGACEDPESFKRGVGGELGEKLTNLLLQACQAGDWEAVEELAPALRRQVHAQRSRLSLAGLRFFWSNVRHHLKPPLSALVVLLGPDGSGKSTIADRAAEVLYKQPFKVCRRFEYNFRIVPELKRFKQLIARMLGRRIAPATEVAPGTRGSGMNRDHGALRGMGYVTYYALDFVVGQLLLRQLRGQGALLIFARYFHDYYYQRGYSKVPRWYLRLLEHLVPTPDLILYLYRPAEEIYRGKPELDLPEIKRQQDVIQALVDARSNAMRVDASAGVERTVADVCERIHRHFLDHHQQ